MYGIKNKTVSSDLTAVGLIHRIGLPGVGIRVIDQKRWTRIGEAVDIRIEQHVIYQIKDRHREIFECPRKTSRLRDACGIRFWNGRHNPNRMLVHVELKESIGDGIDCVYFSVREVSGEILKTETNVIDISAIHVSW